MPAQEGERPEPAPRPDAGALLTRRLDELDSLRGSEAAEQCGRKKRPASHYRKRCSYLPILSVKIGMPIQLVTSGQT